jgi:hypothetical protein
MKAIEDELEVTVRVHEVRLEYQRQMEVYVLFYFNICHPRTFWIRLTRVSSFLLISARIVYVNFFSSAFGFVC